MSCAVCSACIGGAAKKRKRHRRGSINFAGMCVINGTGGSFIYHLSRRAAAQQIATNTEDAQAGRHKAGKDVCQAALSVLWLKLGRACHNGWH